MTKKRVHRIFDTFGKRLSRNPSNDGIHESRKYPVCTAYGAVWVEYIDGRLHIKDAYFG